MDNYDLNNLGKFNNNDLNNIRKLNNYDLIVENSITMTKQDDKNKIPTSSHQKEMPKNIWKQIWKEDLQKKKSAKKEN